MFDIQMRFEQRPFNAVRSLVRLMCFLVAATSLGGCVSPKLEVSAPPGGSEPVKTIALLPSGGPLADAIGLNLLAYGFNVFDPAQTSNLMVRLNLSEIEIMQPQNLRLLKDQGIDCTLQVRSVAGYDNQPESAAIKMVSTSSGKLLAGATWQNGHGGMQGSMADRDARAGMTQAAKQIAAGIAKAVPHDT